MRESDCDSTRSGAYIHNARLLEACGEFYYLFHQMFGLWPWNQHIRCDAKTQAVELRFASNVLDGLTLIAAFE